MQDYIVFFSGYDGVVRQDDDNLGSIQVMSRPTVQSAHSNSKTYPELTRLHDLDVKVYVAKSGHRYNVACQVLPDSDDIESSISMYRPRPVPAR